MGNLGNVRANILDCRLFRRNGNTQVSRITYDSLGIRIALTIIVEIKTGAGLGQALIDNPIPHLIGVLVVMTMEEGTDTVINQ